MGKKKDKKVDVQQTTLDLQAPAEQPAPGTAEKPLPAKDAAGKAPVPFIAPVAVKSRSKISKPVVKPAPEQTKPVATPVTEQAQPAAKALPLKAKPPKEGGVDASDDVNADGESVSAFEGEAAIMDAIKSTDLMDQKFWQKNDYFRSLLDPDVIDKLDFAKYDLAKLLSEFFTEMFKEEYIDFKVSGIAVHSAAKIYRYKITQVLEQQEKEEEERKKEMLRRNIPSTISQPLRAGRAIATQEDFLTSMRSAIIEVMRRREKQAQKLAKQKTSGEVVDADAKKIRMKKSLPESIRKALLGKERIEDTFQRWLEIIYEKIKQSPDKQVSYFHDLKPLVERKDRYGFRFGQARLFLSLMFLRTRDKVDVIQEEEMADMFVKKP